MRTRHPAGFTLVETLVAMLFLAITMAGAVTVFAAHSRAYRGQQTRAAQQDNLRVGMGIFTDALRNGRYGVPTTNLANWIPWVAGFTTNPKITAVGANVTLSVARTSAQPVALLTAGALKGVSTLVLTNYSQVNTGSKRLLLINGQENVMVTAVNAGSVTIDTNPIVVGNQGLTKTYPPNTPVYRVDVLTFSVATDPATGLSQLLRDENAGAGALPTVDGITGLQVATVVAGQQYNVTMTATTPTRDQVTNQFLQSRLVSNVTLAN